MQAGFLGPGDVIARATDNLEGFFRMLSELIEGKGTNQNGDVKIRVKRDPALFLWILKEGAACYVPTVAGDNPRSENKKWRWRWVFLYPSLPVRPLLLFSLNPKS
jgi:hypothetical protein